MLLVRDFVTYLQAKGFITKQTAIRVFPHRQNHKPFIDIVCVIVFDNARVCKAGLSSIVAKALNWNNSVKQGTAFLFKMPEQVHVENSQNNGYVTSKTVKKVYIA